MNCRIFLSIILLTCIVRPSPAQELPGKRAHHALIYDEGQGKVILTGGSTPMNGGSSFVFYDDFWSFDGKSWIREKLVGDKRSGVSLAYDSKRKKIYSLGGFMNNISLSDLRQAKEKEWVSLGTISEPGMTEGGFVYDAARDKFVAFGGSGGRGLINSSTWEWDGKKNWKKAEGTGPDGRQAFALVYDSKRQKTIAFGGMGASPQQLFGDTWEYDGASWKKVSDNGPAARMSMGYTYDSKRGTLVIFGGMSKAGPLGDTWAWDGSEWKQLSSDGPAPRMMGYMAYDNKRDRVVLFGGRLGWPNDTNDTWEWDGNSWTEIE
jgi:hypothetical protein